MPTIVSTTHRELGTIYDFPWELCEDYSKTFPFGVRNPIRLRLSGTIVLTLTKLRYESEGHFSTETYLMLQSDTDLNLIKRSSLLDFIPFKLVVDKR